MTKIYEEGERNYRFNRELFREIVRERQKEQKQSLNTIYEAIGEELHVSPATVQNWYKDKNGPSDIDTIQSLSEALALSDYHLLLAETDGGDMEKNTILITNEMLASSLKRVSDAVMNFLSEFRRTNGFNDLWSGVWQANSHIKEENREWFVEQELLEFADKRLDKVYEVFEKERFYLRGHPIEEELSDFLYGDDGLWKSYDGKMSYAYRFEAPVETVDGHQSGVTTDEDYYKYLNWFYTIIYKYLSR